MHRRPMSLHCDWEGSRRVRDSTLTRLHPLLDQRPNVTRQEGSFYACPRRETFRDRLRSCKILQKGRELFRKWRHSTRPEANVERYYGVGQVGEHGPNPRRLSCHIHLTSPEIGGDECHTSPSTRPRFAIPLRVVVWSDRYGQISPDLDPVPDTLRQANQQMVGRL